MSVTVKTAPSVEPVVADTAGRTHLRIVGSTHDTEITRKLTAARIKVESDTGRKLITQTLVWRRDSWPDGDVLWLPGSPVQSVTHVKYTDAAGAVQTLVDGTDYAKDLYAIPARVLPYYGTQWPSVKEIPNAIEAEYVAGYGDASANVPNPLLEAILLLLGDMFLHRMNERADGKFEIRDPASEAAYWTLITPYILWEFMDDEGDVP